MQWIIRMTYTYTYTYFSFVQVAEGGHIAFVWPPLVDNIVCHLKEGGCVPEPRETLHRGERSKERKGGGKERREEGETGEVQERGEEGRKGGRGREEGEGNRRGNRKVEMTSLYETTRTSSDCLLTTKCPSTGGWM